VLLISNPLNPNNVQFSKLIEGQGRDFSLVCRPHPQGRKSRRSAGQGAD
jgi:hypothetical protein